VGGSPPVPFLINANCRSLRCATLRFHGTPGQGGMTNLRAVAHLGMGGGGWTESSNEGAAVKLSCAESERIAVD